MQALVLDRFGSVDGFRVTEVEKPEPKPGEIRVKVRASSINSWDWELARGSLIARLAAPPRTPWRILGGDVAGIIDKLGEGVSGFAEGDAVYGDVTSSGWGGFADFVTAAAKAFRPMPPYLDFIDASTLPQAGVLALQAIGKRVLGPGSDVLVIGGGGGVGTFAIQMAKAAGARVTAIDDLHKAETMTRAGADFVLDRAETDLRTHAARYDLVVDPVLFGGVAAQFGMLRPGGVYAIVGGRGGALLQSVALGPLIGRLTGKSSTLVMWSPRGPELDELAGLVERGTVIPVIEKVYPLAEGVAAMRHFAEGRALGKLVIAPGAG